MVFTQLACLAVLEITGIFAFEVIVSPINPAVRENDPVTLTCSISGDGTVQYYTWALIPRGSDSPKPVGILKKDCIEEIVQVNSTLYNYSCPDDRHMTWIIKKVERKNIGDKYQCTISIEGNTTTSSNSSILNLKIPVTSVTMTLPVTNEITLTENIPTSFQCVTSESLPEATVKWYKDPQSPADTKDDIEITTSVSSSVTVTIDQVKIKNSSLIFSPVRTDNNKNVFCSASNGDGDVMSSRKLLIVHYPPNGGPVIQEGQTFSVIQNTPNKLTCYITGGNPLPLLSWSCYQGQVNDSSEGNTVTKVVSWAASRVEDSSCVCSSSHYSGNKSASISIAVLYPPSSPTFLIGVTEVSGTIKAILGNRLSVVCVSRGKPNPGYTWQYNNGTKVNSSQLFISNIQISSNGNFTCEVENTMLPTRGNPVTTSQKTSVTVQVLYPPTVQDLPNVNIVEGMRLSVTCRVISSNPPVSKYQWTRQRDDNTVWKNQILEIPNVKKTDAANYTCTVYNTMKPTAETEEDGQDFKSFFLNVWYNTTITSFTLNDSAGDIVVKENDSDLRVTCLVDSNPESYILLQHNNRTLSSRAGVKFLSLTIGKAMCTDAGRYTCVGYNQYNTRNSSKDLNLSVKCSPRPSPFFDLKENVTSALHRTCTIQFTALAYPQPKTSEYSWFKYENLQWTLIQNNTDVFISTSGLNSSLTVLNVTESSFGAYKLTVRNEIGSWEQLFSLNAEDVPNTPTGFINLEDQATDTSLSFQWYPGFNGGPQQTFVLQYKKLNDQNWTSINISHAGESTLTYNIKPLMSDTQYEVMLFAINRIGSSRSSLNITVSTKQSTTPGPANPPGALIGGVGGTSGIGIVVVVVIIRRRRLRKGTEASQLALYKTGRQQTEENSSDEDVMVENNMYEPAGQIIAKDEPVYNKPSKKVKVDANNADVYAVVDKSKKKENQKKKGKQKQSKHQGDIYENAPEKSTAGNNTYGNAAFEDNPYEIPESSRPSLMPKKHVNPDGLIYADLAFNDQPKGQKKLVIHGLDDMTTYVQVDFNKKADPLPDSDTEEQSENKKK